MLLASISRHVSSSPGVGYGCYSVNGWLVGDFSLDLLSVHRFAINGEICQVITPAGNITVMGCVL